MRRSVMDDLTSGRGATMEVNQHKTIPKQNFPYQTLLKKNKL